MRTTPDRRRRADATMLAAAVGVLVGAVTLGTVQRVAATTSQGDRAIFEPLSPARILDTRDGTGVPGGTSAPLGAGASLDLQVAGAAGVPADAVAVVMNVTYVDATTPSFVTIWPAGEARPGASNLNPTPGPAVPNLVTVKLGAGGKVSFFNFAGSTNLLADVAGFYQGHDFDDRYYTKPQIDARLSALTGANVTDGSLHLADLGSATPPGTRVVPADIAIPNHGCGGIFVKLSFDPGIIGTMVLATLTDDKGEAVLPNAATVVPTTVIATNQGGAEAKVLVCSEDNTNLTIPAGTIIHYRLIDP